MNTVTLRLEDYEQLCEYKSIVLNKGVYIDGNRNGVTYVFTESESCKTLISRIEELNRVIRIKDMRMEELRKPKKNKRWFLWMR